jgi:hypothetical protein
VDGSVESLFGETNRLWWAGWRFKTCLLLGSILSAFTLGLTFSALVGAVGFFFGMFLGTGFGILIWYTGMKQINREGPKVLDRFVEVRPEIGRRRLNFSGENPTGYHFLKGYGSAPAIDVAKTYRATVMLVGNSSVAIHEGVDLDMSGRGSKVRDGTRELFYDQIASVSYQNEELVIRTSDGDSLTYPTTQEPTDALHDLQEKVREHKE